MKGRGKFDDVHIIQELDLEDALKVSVDKWFCPSLRAERAHDLEGGISEWYSLRDFFVIFMDCS